MMTRNTVKTLDTEFYISYGVTSGPITSENPEVFVATYSIQDEPCVFFEDHFENHYTFSEGELKEFISHLRAAMKQSKREFKKRKK